MSDEAAHANRDRAQHPNRAFVLRLLWDSEGQHHRVQLRPADGSKALIFEDLEAAFLHIDYVLRRLDAQDMST